MISTPGLTAGLARYSGVLDPDRHRRLFTSTAAVVVTLAGLQLTNALPYYPTGWRYLLLAVIAILWIVRPGVGQAAALASLVLPVAYSLNVGQSGIWIAVGGALVTLVLLEPFSCLVVLTVVGLLTVNGPSGLVIVAPLALAAVKPPRAALAAGLGCLLVLLVSLAAGRPVVGAALSSPIGTPLASVAAAPVTSILDFSWTTLPGRNEGDALNTLLTGLWRPFADSPVLLGQVGLWVLVAAITSLLVRRTPWDGPLLRAGRETQGTLRVATALLVGGLLLGLGELAVVAAAGSGPADAPGVLIPALVGGLLVGALWPILSRMPTALSDAGGFGSLLGPIPAERPRSAGGARRSATGDAGPSAYQREIPHDSWTELAGIADIQAEIEEAIASQFNPEVAKTLHAMSLRPTRGILLFGPPGTGKTKIARVIAAQARARFFSVSGSEFSSKWFGESEANLRQIFDSAKQARPSVVFFDELEAFLPKRTEMSRADAPEKRVVSTFLGLTDGVGSLDGVLLVGATNYPDLIDEAALRPGRFDKLIYISPPDRAARRLIFERYLVGRPLGPDVDLDALAERTERYTGADIQAVCVEAGRSALRRTGSAQTPQPITGADLGHAISGSKPTVTFEMIRKFEVLADQYGRRTDKAPVVQVVERPTLGWDDVAGLEAVKEALRESVELPLQRPELYREYGVAPPKGVLLFGPPGCGKTFLARVVASTSGAHFISVKGPELMRSRVGASEAQLRTLFDRARENAPCVLFFDEIDAFAMARGAAGAGDTQMLTQLLTEMDGFDLLKGVVVIAATNRPEILDPALRRPGRFDRLVYVPPPDAAAREALFRHELAGKPTELEIDLATLAKLTEGRSGADIADICRAAALGAAKDAVTLGERQLVGMARLIAQIERTVPSISGEQMAAYEEARKQLAR